MGVKLPSKYSHLKFEDWTHGYRCKHCVGYARCCTYYMHCILLGESKNSLKKKVLIFGERNWKYQEGDKAYGRKKIAYVDAKRLVLRKDLVIEK